MSARWYTLPISGCTFPCHTHTSDKSQRPLVHSTTLKVRTSLACPYFYRNILEVSSNVHRLKQHQSEAAINRLTEQNAYVVKNFLLRGQGIPLRRYAVADAGNEKPGGSQGMNVPGGQSTRNPSLIFR